MGRTLPTECDDCDGIIDWGDFGDGPPTCTCPPPPPRLGPCGICGWHPDQRHRVRDAIFERLLAGEPLSSVCADYEMTGDEIMTLHLDIDANLVEMIRGEP